MKKTALLTLTLTVQSIMPWSLPNFWHSASRYFPDMQSSKTAIQQTWNAFTPEQQKMALIGTLLAVPIIAYTIWPDTQQVAYEKAEKQAKEWRGFINNYYIKMPNISELSGQANINNQKKITKDDLENKRYKKTFHYGLPRSGNQYIVIADQQNIIGKGLFPQVTIKDWLTGESLSYVPNSIGSSNWTGYVTEGFFKKIKRIETLEALD